MTAINIFNKRHYAKRDHPDSHTFYCGRRMRDLAGSPLANPFKITKSLNRRSVLYLYERHFNKIVNGDDVATLLRREFMQALADIILVYEQGIDVDLLCWCTPDANGNSVPCHCDMIRDYVLKVTTL